VNTDVDVRTKTPKRRKTLRKTFEKHKKQPTEKQKNSKYRSMSYVGAGFNS